MEKNNSGLTELQLQDRRLLGPFHPHVKVQTDYRAEQRTSLPMDISDLVHGPASHATELTRRVHFVDPNSDHDMWKVR